MDTMIQMKQLNDLLTSALKEFKKRGQEYAKSYSNYRKLVEQELLRLKAEGMPVTISYDIARGKEEVAQAKEQEIITECLYKSCQEAIQAYKLQIKILQEQINKELAEG